MPVIPFELLGCSWPRPVVQASGVWTSSPEWDAPAMPAPPAPRWRTLGGEPCWSIDWRDWARSGLKTPDPLSGGEMSGFHVVFRVRATADGRLTFWSDDGCVIRRGGLLAHDDRRAHPPEKAEIDVEAGDVLEVAQWQLFGDWVWGARLDAVEDASAPLLAYRDAVIRRLERPEGPPVKMYTGGKSPLRAVLAVYSLVLNGYAPSDVLIYGEYQWPPRTRELISALLPFARVVPTGPLLNRIGALCGGLADLARAHWTVMKLCVTVMLPPYEFCHLDDDVIILDRLDDALGAFAAHDLVFSTNKDVSGTYRTFFEVGSDAGRPLSTGRLNTGLYWLRTRHDPLEMAARVLRFPPPPGSPRNPPPEEFLWEQGFVATEFARDSVFPLSSRRYFLPLFDGLPGGVFGYPYAENPCQFAAVHFAGLVEKPGDDFAFSRALNVLGQPGDRETGSPPTYLDDLAVRESLPGGASPGLRGELGDGAGRVSALGSSPRHALCVRPPSRLVVPLNVDENFPRFRCRVAVNDDTPGDAYADFRVHVDGRLAAIALRVAAGDPPRDLEADVSGARVVELEARPSRWAFVNAVWLEPTLDRGAVTPRGVPFVDCLGRVEVDMPYPRREVDRAIVTVASLGYGALLDDMLGSLAANGGCPGVPVFVFVVDPDAVCLQIVSGHGARAVACSARDRPGPALRSLLYSSARVVAARSILCLHADTLILGDLSPVFGAIEAQPGGRILACRDADHRDRDSNPDLDDGLFAGDRASLLALDEMIRQSPDGSDPMKPQQAFNRALARLGCAAELAPEFNVQLHGRAADWRRDDDGRVIAESEGRRARVVHFNGQGRFDHPAWMGLFARR